MAYVSLPKRFSEKISEDQFIQGVVSSTLNRYGEILKNNDLFFFNEYTDHGIEHIENVLRGANHIITNETFENILTPEDIGYFTLAVILHDLAMHLSLEGFKLLIEGSYKDDKIDILDKLSWSVLWEDFLNEAKKFDGKQLRSLFGDENTVVRIPPLNQKGTITENDKKLIGEFIRRHHARLAHEIALKGFPANDTTIPFAEEIIDTRRKHLIGLIARSHGIDIRDTFNFLELEHSRAWKTPLRIHAIFLMVVLRIADYLQIDKSRSSQVLVKVKAFSSPLSQLEHEAHLAVDCIIDKYHDDPEKVYVQTNPQDSIMYLKLKKLFQSIQYELDISWAVLGEVYGKENDTDKPVIKFRRITSNMDEDSFASKQSYIPEIFHFSANQEIIKLLIGPLYGNDPSYGVREILQNAVDACNEREKILTGSNYTPVVTVNINVDSKGRAYFEVIDNGKGMSKDEIQNYFLIAGASYRKSIEWQKKYVEENKVTVQRNGKFGVGALAAFLLGKEIEVTTRHMNNNYGFSFCANLYSEQINVTKVYNINIGTKIRVYLTNETLDMLKNIDENNNNRSSCLWYKWYAITHP